jgi:hypothetical protein
MADLTQPPRGEPLIRAIAMPADANPSGDIFGGWLMAQMDLAAANVAARGSRGRCITVAVDGICSTNRSLSATKSASTPLSAARARSWLGSAQRILDPFDRFRASQNVVDVRIAGDVKLALAVGTRDAGDRVGAWSR